jgi:hypothetical protein
MVEEKRGRVYEMRSEENHKTILFRGLSMEPVHLVAIVDDGIGLVHSLFLQLVISASSHHLLYTSFSLFVNELLAYCTHGHRCFNLVVRQLINF